LTLRLAGTLRKMFCLLMSGARPFHKAILG